MINQNYQNNNYSNRENYQFINDFKYKTNNHGFTPSLEIPYNSNIIKKEKKIINIPNEKIYLNKEVNNLKLINKRNPNIILNSISTEKKKSIEISKNINLSESNNEKNNKRNITINSSSLIYNTNKINNIYNPQIRSQSNNNSNNLQFLTNNINEQKISVQDNYISFLQKQLDDTVKKNKELIMMYKEIEKTLEKVNLENKKLNLKLIESENKFNEFNLKNEELKLNNKNIQNKLNKKEIELENKIKEKEKENELLKITLNDLQKNNNELKQNLLSMSNKLTNSLNKDSNIFEKELNLLKEQNDILTKNLLSKNQNLENLQNENNELNTENRILKDQIEDYKNQYNLLKNSIKYYNKNKININESKDSFLTNEIINLTMDGTNTFIYKKKSSENFAFNNFKKKKKIDEIKLKIPSKSNPKIKEIPIKYNETYDNENDFFSKKINNNNTLIHSYNFKNNEINDLFIQSSILEQKLKNYETFNFIINPLEKCLFNIDKDLNIIKFEIKTKKFSLIKIKNNPLIKIYDDYINNFYYEGTIILNTLNGIFILTGKNIDILYYYNNENNTIRKICQFKNSHNSGSLLLDEEKKNIIVLSGKYNKKVEYFSFENGTINFYPDLNIERANSTYCLINNKLFSFFGFCCPLNTYNNNIEFINFSLMDSWKFISFKLNENDINLNIHCISNIKFKGKYSIIIFGGIRNEGDIFFDNFLSFDTENNIISKIIIKNNQNYGCIFSKNSNFIQIDDNYLLIDDNNNVHIVDNNLHFSLFKFNL